MGRLISEAAKEVSNWLLGEVSRILNSHNIEINKFSESVSPEQLHELIAYSHSHINVATAKTVLEEMFNSGKPALSIIIESGLSQKLGR